MLYLLFCPSSRILIIQDIVAFGRINTSGSGKADLFLEIFRFHLTACMTITYVFIGFSLAISREDLKWDRSFCVLTEVHSSSINKKYESVFNGNAC